MIYIIIMDIGEIIRRLRENKKLSQIKLAEMSGIEQSKISRIESSKTTPKFDIVCMLSDALGLSPKDLWKAYQSQNIELAIKEDISPYEKMIPVPFYGHVAAGSPFIIEDHLGKQINVSTNLIHGSQPHFAVCVKGNSMIDCDIKDGDVVLIRAQSTAENGEIVVVTVENEATLKKFYKRNGRIELQQCNKSMKSQFVRDKDIRIQGIFVAVVKT